MTPDDVLIEAIAAASLHGDSAALRQEMCRKLKEAVDKLMLSPHGENDAFSIIKSAKE